MGGDIRRRNDEVFREVYEPFLAPRRTASSDTQAIQWMIERKLLELAMNRFEWKNLPEEIDIRWLEMSINFYGLAVFFYDEDYGKYFALRGAGIGQLNMMGNPIEFMVYGNGYYEKTVKAEECVPIWANYMRMPDWDIIRIYSQRIAEMDRTIEINSKSARRTKIMTMSENGRLTAENVNRQIDDGAAVIKVADNIVVDQMINNIDLSVDPDSIINMHMLRTREWQEAVNMLGINTSNQDKKERMVASESAGNDDLIATIRATNLQARQQACEQINRMFPDIALNSEDGEGVSVEYVTGMVTDPSLRDPNEQPGSTLDGKKEVQA